MTDRRSTSSAEAARRNPAGRFALAEGGFSLIEALTATVIAVIAVLGLAYTFSVGRGQVNRYAVARAALGAVEGQMEQLLRTYESTPGSALLAVGYRSPLAPFVYQGATLGTIWWHVDGHDDPNIPGTPPDLRRLAVCVRWNTSVPDSVQLDQLLMLP